MNEETGPEIQRRYQNSVIRCSFSKNARIGGSWQQELARMACFNICPRDRLSVLPFSSRRGVSSQRPLYFDLPKEQASRSLIANEFQFHIIHLR